MTDTERRDLARGDRAIIVYPDLPDRRHIDSEARLEEAKGPNNDVLDPPARDALAAELGALGVHVGRSGWQLERALCADVGRGWRLPSVAEDLAEVFGA